MSRDPDELDDDQKAIYEAVDRFNALADYFWMGVPFRFHCEMTATFENVSVIPGMDKLELKHLVLSTSSTDDSEITTEEETKAEEEQEIVGEDDDESAGE